MMITVVFGHTCPACSCPLLGWMVYTVRVNKGSLRTRGGGLGIVPRCDCGGEVDAVSVESAWLHGADREQVNAERARKGWPPLTDWRLVPRSADRLEVTS